MLDQGHNCEICGGHHCRFHGAFRPIEAKTRAQWKAEREDKKRYLRAIARAK
jgi:hypothetical protein